MTPTNAGTAPRRRPFDPVAFLASPGDRLSPLRLRIAAAVVAGAQRHRPEGLHARADRLLLRRSLQLAGDGQHAQDRRAGGVGLSARRLSDGLRAGLGPGMGAGGPAGRDHPAALHRRRRQGLRLADRSASRRHRLLDHGRPGAVGRARAAAVYGDRPRPRRRQRVPPLHDPARLLGGEAHGCAPQRSRRNAGGDAPLSVPAHHAAADAAGRRHRHRVRLLALRLHVRHPEPSDRRPLPDARNPHWAGLSC